MKSVLTADTQYAFVDERGQAAIDEWREDLGQILQSSGPSLQEEGSRALWWTFAGGRINHTLKYALEWREGWKVIADNFTLRVEGNGVTGNAVRAAIEAISTPAFWDDERTRAGLLAKVPEYRLSKFQRALPEKFEVEMVGAYLLDFDGSAAFLRAAPPES
jgi:ATP-dependent Lhr-like helicase